jgi:hypothetical protein
MLVIIRLKYRSRRRSYYFGVLPIKKPFIALEIENRTLPDIWQRVIFRLARLQAFNLRNALDPSGACSGGKFVVPGRRGGVRCAAQRMRMKRAPNILIAIGAMLIASPAFAHHSHAMFDSEKKVTLVGTVKEFEWDNPHCWIQVLVPNPDDPNAAPVEWGVEMDSPLAMFRRGWKPGTLKVGDKITVVINPLRDGRPSGQYVSATGPDGKPLGTAPEAPK